MSEVSFDHFTPEEQCESYLSHMAQQDTLSFANSSGLVNKAINWLDEVEMENKYAVEAEKGMGNDGLLILKPRSTAQPNREFSKNAGKSNLAKMKSKLGPK